MKRLLVFVFACSVIFIRCSKDNDNVRSGTGDFMISISVDGITHKAEGSIPSDLQSSLSMYGNHSLKYGNNTVIAGLSDKSAASYVSGEVFFLNIIFPNLSLGNSVGILSGMSINSSASTYGTNLSNLISNGIILTYGLSQTIDTISANTLTGKAEMNFNITDLGTIGSSNLNNANNTYIFGNPLRGSFSGTMYGSDGTSIGSRRIYNIPVQIEIEFIAARSQY